MNPVYRFQITPAGGTTTTVHPIYGDGLTKDFERESGEQFFRAKLSGKLTFNGSDYALINGAAFDTEFRLNVLISYNGGSSWSQYWAGSFWKTDCEFDDDARTVVVTPSVRDAYKAVLAGLDKEYDLITLSPAITPIKAKKRPMIQCYIPDDNVVGCFLSGMWWEQECTPTPEGQLHNYSFVLNKGFTNIRISGTMTPVLPDMVSDSQTSNYFDITQDGYRFRRYSVSGTYDGIEIQDSGGTALWRNNTVDMNAIRAFSVQLNPVTGSGAYGVVTLDIETIRVFARLVLDLPTYSGVSTTEIGANDIVPNNRNYRYVTPWNKPNTIVFSNATTTTPNQWGLYRPGEYYKEPYALDGREFYPICRNSWGFVSVWYSFSQLAYSDERAGQAEFTIKHAYKIANVISTLLAQIAPGITHLGTTGYSEFLYGENLAGITQYLAIVPKSNITSSGYDQPAQTAPITMRQVLDMLRDCFRCYWWIDSNNRFRIEHIKYFMNGGSYSGTPSVGIDLTALIETRNGKPWAYGRNQYKFEKPDMPERYQFGWMDEVSQLFKGYPIDMVSGYVEPGVIEQITIANFTSDLDYCLLNPSAVSKDGFVLLAATLVGGEYVMPFYDYQIGVNHHYLQNAYVAFVLMERWYYVYDLPARNYAINGAAGVALGIKKLKMQNIRFPAYNDPDLFDLVRTNLGDGVIEKFSINLQSRGADVTLKYDTE